MSQKSPVSPSSCSESVVLPGHLDLDNPTAKPGKQLWLLLSSTHGGGQGSSAGADCRCPRCGHHWPAASFHPPPASESFPCLRTWIGTYMSPTQSRPPTQSLVPFGPSWRLQADLGGGCGPLLGRWQGCLWSSPAVQPQDRIPSSAQSVTAPNSVGLQVLRAGLRSSGSSGGALRLFLLLISSVITTS